LTELHPAFLGPPIAHRGLHDRARGVIENSRAAVAAAVAAGYGVEIDVQEAACGEPMVFHDDDLPRLTGVQGPVRDRSAAELAEIELRGGDETVPRLAEILDRVAGRAPLLIEIKDQTLCLGPDVGALERRVAALLEGYGGPVAVMSFNPHSVAAMAEAAPKVARGLTSCAFGGGEWRVTPARRAALAELADYEAAGAGFISHDRRNLDGRGVKRVRALGARVLCWTVRSPAEEAAARRFADNVTFEGYAAAIPD
jgi:glycerophosphoryl diester phosphodiesterase